MKPYLRDFVSSRDLGIDLMMQAIAQIEGNGYLHNNPGNIMDIEYYKQTKLFRLQQYPKMQEGWIALANLLKSTLYLGNIHNTFYDIFRKYAPSSHGGNNPDLYAKLVAEKLGLDPSLPAKPQMDELREKRT